MKKLLIYSVSLFMEIGSACHILTMLFCMFCLLVGFRFIVLLQQLSHNIYLNYILKLIFDIVMYHSSGHCQS